MPQSGKTIDRMVEATRMIVERLICRDMTGRLRHEEGLTSNVK